MANFCRYAHLLGHNQHKVCLLIITDRITTKTKKRRSLVVNVCLTSEEPWASPNAAFPLMRCSARPSVVDCLWSFLPSICIQLQKNMFYWADTCPLKNIALL